MSKKLFSKGSKLNQISVSPHGRESKYVLHLFNSNKHLNLLYKNKINCVLTIEFLRQKKTFS